MLSDVSKQHLNLTVDLSTAQHFLENPSFTHHILKVLPANITTDIFKQPTVNEPIIQSKWHPPSPNAGSIKHHRTLPIASCQTSATPAGTIVPTRMSQKEMSFFHSLQNYPSLLHCRESSQRRFRIRSSINSHYAFCARQRWWFSITLTFHKQSRARAASVRLLAHDYVRSLWCFITLLDCTGNGTTSSFRNRNDCSPSSRSVPFAFVYVPFI